MATVPVRKDSAEIKAITEIMEDTRYKTAEDMAVAILKVAYDSFRNRRWFAHGVLWKGKPYKVYGLEATEANAWKNTEGLAYRDKAVWPIEPFSEYLAVKDEAIADAEFVPNPNCVNLTSSGEVCGHQEWAHTWTDGRGKRTHPKAANKLPRCGINCDCPGFVSEAQAEREAIKAEQDARRQARLEAA